MGGTGRHMSNLVAELAVCSVGLYISICIVEV